MGESELKRSFASHRMTGVREGSLSLLARGSRFVRGSFGSAQILCVVGLLVFSVGFASSGERAEVARNSKLGQQNWARYGGSPENDHYSSLAQINRKNVSRLAVAWSFDTGEEG